MILYVILIIKKKFNVEMSFNCPKWQGGCMGPSGPWVCIQKWKPKANQEDTKNNSIQNIETSAKEICHKKDGNCQRQGKERHF